MATPHELLDAFDGYRELNDPHFRKAKAFDRFKKAVERGHA